jgi:hypothetical protein
MPGRTFPTSRYVSRAASVCRVVRIVGVGGEGGGAVKIGRYAEVYVTLSGVVAWILYEQAKSMSTKGPHVPEENVWAEMTFDY